MQEIICFQCGKKFKRKRSQIEKSKYHFCSSQCYWESHRKKRICPNCRKEEVVRKIDYLRNKFCSQYCWNEHRKKQNRKAFIDKFGYWCLIKKGKNGKRQHIRIHTLIAEKVLNRNLKRNEIVHHINMIKADNRHKNLLICSNGYHSQIHNQMAKRYAMEHFA